MDQLVKAEAPGFIWLIVGVFWVIAQIAGAAAKKNQSLRPPVDDNDHSTPEDPHALSHVEGFAELLRKMAGAEPFRVEPPEFEEEPEEKPWKPGEIEKLPDIEPLRRETAGQAEKIPASAKVPEIDIRPKMSAFRNSVPSIKLPAMSLSFQGSETSVRKVPNIGTEQSVSAFGIPEETTRMGVAKIVNPSDKNSLRRAMLSHIIFSPPKAME